MRAVRPTFLVIGEQKAGTGWIRDRLQEHPDVFMCNREINFFNRKQLFAKGVGWYFNHFSGGAGKQAVGEKSPEYFWQESGRHDYIQDIDARIEELLGEIRLVVSLRNPIDRAVSAFQHHLRHRGRRIPPRLVEHYSPLQLLTGEAIDLSPYGILERGFYMERLKSWLDRFGEQVLVLVFEDDIAARPDVGMQRICNHIGVDYHAAGFEFDSNPKEDKPSLGAITAGYWLPILRPVVRRLDFGSPYRLELSQDERAELAAVYETDVKGLRQLLNRNVWTKDWSL